MLKVESARQGGPWSSWLFNLVMNDLICKFEKKVI